ncbi:protein DMP4-like [Macadamia integrifolia]|uniref:protein DMP4-like n=1 Tax=Macadamia integrifolia TaxID=60698 RepID=UPI001C52FE5E|nr:protein DMP4-like [Macadamia integrifolia]
MGNKVEGEKKKKIMDEEEQRHHDQQHRPLLGHHHDQQHQPLLCDSTSNLTSPRRKRVPDPNLIQQVISQTFRSTAHLANLLPTGTVLAFQLLSPIFSNQGYCDDASQFMTAGLVILCGLSCFLSSYTDSYRDDKGAVHFGIATFRGLWIIDGSITVPLDQASEFRLKFIDFLHAFMSTLVFAAIALLDQNVENCFYPTPSDETMEVLTALPVGIGLIGSAFFITFPTTRHGLGFPLSPR